MSSNVEIDTYKDETEKVELWPFW